MSAISRFRNRSGKVNVRKQSYGRGNQSYNARIHQYSNGIPRPGQRPPKKLKTKRKYANVQSKYSSVFSKYLHEPTYPPSVKAHKNRKGPSKNFQQDRLIKRIFGNENNLKAIKSLMNNSQIPQGQNGHYVQKHQINYSTHSNNLPKKKFNNHSSPKYVNSKGEQPYDDSIHK